MDLNRYSNSFRNLHYIFSFLPIFAFVIFLSYFLRVFIELGHIPEFHKAESYSLFHSELVDFFLAVGFISPIFWIIITLLFKKYKILVSKKALVIFLIGFSAFYIYLLFIDPFNLLGWYAD